MDPARTGGSGGEEGAAVVLEDESSSLSLHGEDDQKLTSKLNVALAYLGHQIRAPLITILGHTEILFDLVDREDSEAQSSLTKIAAAVKSLSNTVQSLFDLAQMESACFRIRSGPVNLDRILEHKISEYETLAGRKGLRLKYINELHPQAAVIADEYALGHALKNLLDNAVKFTERGAVILRLYLDHDGLPCISVEDTGTGISAEFLERLAEPLSQEGADGLHVLAGSGLGLTLARRYLNLMGARLVVASEKARGSVFKVVFPSGLL